MAKLIKFGFYNKKLFLPFGVAFLQIILNIMNIVVKEKTKNQILEMLGVSLSEMAIALIPLFNIYSFKPSTHDLQRSKKTIIKDFLILMIIFTLYVGLTIYKSNLSSRYYLEKKSLSNPHNSGLSSFESLELIFITISCVLLLKYKYFIHHIISIFIFIFISFFIDYILNNFPDLYDRGPLFIILSIILVMIDAFDYAYQKRIMDVLFYPYWSVPLTLGIINFIIFGFIMIIILIKGKENSFKEENFMFIAFYKYFEEVDIGIIIIKHILNFVLNFFLNLLRTLMILYFTPDFILISFTFSRIIDIIIETEQYICIVLFILQLITLMFYLEIFEFNFCGLNKNTRRNIQERERKEMLLQEESDNSSRKSTLSIIEVSPDYIIHIDDNSINHGENSQNDLYDPNNELKIII